MKKLSTILIRAKKYNEAFNPKASGVGPFMCLAISRLHIEGKLTFDERELGITYCMAEVKKIHENCHSLASAILITQGRTKELGLWNYDRTSYEHVNRKVHKDIREFWLSKIATLKAEGK